MTNDAVLFDDLMQIRVGGADMTIGRGVTFLEEISNIEQWKIKANALREIYRWTLGCKPENINVPPDTVVESEEECEGYVRRRVSYFVAPDERISAWMLIPDNLTEKRPAILCLHPTCDMGKDQAIGMDKTPAGMDRAYALHLVKRGYVTFAYDLMGAGERIFHGLQSFDTEPFYMKYPNWSARGKDIHDVGCALNVLTNFPEVDPDRIGMIGHSQGGGISIEMSALDRRIKAAVSSCGGWPLRMNRNPFSCARTEWWIGRPVLRPFCFTGKTIPIDLHELMALSAPRALMVQIETEAPVTGARATETERRGFASLEKNVSRIFSLYGANDHFRFILHEHGHGFAEPERKEAWRFLDDMLMHNCSNGRKQVGHAGR